MIWPILWFMQFLAFLGAYFAHPDISALKHQAFQRGHMVECVGKTGYYWECEK